MYYFDSHLYTALRHGAGPCTFAQAMKLGTQKGQWSCWGWCVPTCQDLTSIHLRDAPRSYWLWLDEEFSEPRLLEGFPQDLVGVPQRVRLSAVMQMPEPAT
mmetsp:Transcript_121377/g.288387  ORF Transcript_121377/g.288387 Transcript_121377/m.288387 type:complete len:101 (-) Transcript_121377:416-718(-)